jgi:hypothetical protein
MDALTSRQAAALLGVSSELVTYKCRTGKLKAWTAAYPSRYGRRWLIDPQQFVKPNGNGVVKAESGIGARVTSAEERLSRIEAFLYGPDASGV